jgi:hypothetical protein
MNIYKNGRTIFPNNSCRVATRKRVVISPLFPNSFKAICKLNENYYWYNNIWDNGAFLISLRVLQPIPSIG